MKMKCALALVLLMFFPLIATANDEMNESVTVADVSAVVGTSDEGDNDPEGHQKTAEEKCLKANSFEECTKECQATRRLLVECQARNQPVSQSD